LIVEIEWEAVLHDQWGEQQEIIAVGRCGILMPLQDRVTVTLPDNIILLSIDMLLQGVNFEWGAPTGRIFSLERYKSVLLHLCIVIIWQRHLSPVLERSFHIWQGVDASFAVLVVLADENVDVYAISGSVFDQILRSNRQHLPVIKGLVLDHIEFSFVLASMLREHFMYLTLLP